MVHDFLPQVRQILRQYSLFNIVFIALGTFEVLCCLVCFSLLTHSHLFAITLAIFLMTFFTYFILKIYFLNKKPENLLLLCEKTLEDLSSKAHDMQNMFEKDLFIASSLTRLANALKDIESSFYTPPKNFENLRQSFEKLGSWLHWKDFHLIKEWLYLQTIQLYVNLIKEQPDHLQLHMALANTWVMFSSIYSTSLRGENSEEDRWTPSEKYSEAIKTKFTLCAQRAIEEFKILNDYNPEDPWVYTQLAYSYHDLQMPGEEIKAYEKIVALVPNDLDALYKLGTLYFEQGFTAKGLKIYEQLKHQYPSKASSLIKHYDSFNETFVLID